jgi:membrane protein DedA with SNARE-associated domain
MPAPDLISHYGYAAIVLGTFFEGETVMLAAGAAAGAGYLNLAGIIAASMTGIFASDTVCFFMGRLVGNRLVRWFPSLHVRLAVVFRMIERHDQKLILGFQFVPGLCTVTPVAFGMTRISAGRFMALDLVGNAAWTLIFAFAGYIFGQVFTVAFPGARPWIFGATLAVVVAGAAVYFWRRSHNTVAIEAEEVG